MVKNQGCGRDERMGMGCLAVLAGRSCGSQHMVSWSEADTLLMQHGSSHENFSGIGMQLGQQVWLRGSLL
jgi:hypothetical protein